MQIDRVGCFKYENVKGSKSFNMQDQIPEPIKSERFSRLMEKAQEISSNRLQRKIGSVQEVIVDQIDIDGAICRTKADAPEIDGNLFIDSNFQGLKPGEFCKVIVDEASEYDLWGTLT